MSRYLLTAALCLILGCRAPAAKAEKLPRDLARYDFADVTAKLDAARQGQNVGLILVKDGKVIYEHAFGGASLNTVEPIASATKMPTVTAVMTLVDQGKLKLDDPVARYLTDWPKDKAAMTLRQCMSNTSGLPGTAATIRNPFTTLARCVENIGTTPLRAAPGTAFIYGGDGFQVAGRVAEVVSGKPWRTFFADAIAKPLGMEVFNYGRAPNPQLGGGARSDLEDYARLLILHLEKGRFGGKQILKPASIAAMQVDEVGDKRILGSPFPDGRHYGLSWWLTPAAAGQPVTEFSDPGAFGAWPWIDTRRGYGGFLLIRSDLRVGARLATATIPAIDAILDHAAGAVTPAARPGR